MLGAGVLLLGGGLFEAGSRGGTDGDNPAESLIYLQEHGRMYFLSGMCLVLAAVLLLAAATGIPWRSPFTTALGTVAAAMFLLIGALRMSTPGPVGYIADLDQAWGESAYLAVQMTGTQAALTSGIVAVGLWAAVTSISAWSRRALPRLICVLGTVGLLYPLGSIIVNLTGWEAGSGVWLTMVGAVFLGLPVWCVAAGIVLVTKRPERTSAPVQSTGNGG